jgi:hypothetical protein
MGVPHYKNVLELSRNVDDIDLVKCLQLPILIKMLLQIGKLLFERFNN